MCDATLLLQGTLPCESVMVQIAQRSHSLGAPRTLGTGRLACSLSGTSTLVPVGGDNSAAAVAGPSRELARCNLQPPVRPIAEHFYDSDDDETDAVESCSGGAALAPEAEGATMLHDSQASATLLSELSFATSTRSTGHAATRRFTLFGKVSDDVLNDTLGYSMDSNTSASVAGTIKEGCLPLLGEGVAAEQCFVEGVDTLGDTLRSRSPVGGHSMGSTARRLLEQELLAIRGGGHCHIHGRERQNFVDDQEEISALAADGPGGCSMGATAARILQQELAATAPDVTLHPGQQIEEPAAPCCDAAPPSVSRCAPMGGCMAMGGKVEQRQLEAFATAVRNASGLEGTLQNDLLALLGQMPVEK